MFQKLKNLKAIAGVNEVMCIGSVKESVTKTGKPFLDLSLSQDDMSVSIKIWDNDDRYEDIQKIPVQSLLSAKISFDGVKGGYDQYSLHEYKILKRPSLIDCVEIESLKKELRDIISNKIEDAEIKEIVFKLFKDPKLKEMVFTAPLTEKSGYSFKGGLLANIVRTCKLCIAITEVYDNWNFNKEDINAKLNLSVLLGASILSNVGAGVCYEIVDDIISKTYKGNLNESSYYSAKILVDLLKDSGMLEEKKDYLEHVITSSKGTLSFGALNTPRTKEANVFHNIQRIDTLMGNFEYMEKISFGDFCKLGQGENQKQYCVLDYDNL